MKRMIHAGQKSPGRDVRDRLILALYAQLKAERDTREALEYVIRHGAVSAEVLEAMASDPVPAAAGSDIAAVERVVAFDRSRRSRGNASAASGGGRMRDEEAS
jgi:hypothetical protein